MTWSFLCPICRGSGYVQVGVRPNGKVGVRPLSHPDFHRLDHVRCSCAGKSMETYS